MGSEPLRSTDPRALFGPDDAPPTERSAVEDHPRWATADDVERRLIEAFHRDGVAILRRAVPSHLCSEAMAEAERRFGSDGPDRLTNSWWDDPAVRAIATAPAVLAAVELLYDRTPIPFQTLVFRRGTEQPAHRDEVHFDSLPPSFVCGVWVALEDIGQDQGPIRYRPGSHRDRRPGIRPVGPAAEQDGPTSEAIAERGPDPAVLDGPDDRAFIAEAGDAIIWAAGVLHGGGTIIDPESTRWSQVTHHFFEGCAWYTPLHSDAATGSLELRDPLIDIGTGRVRAPTVFGERARFIHGPGGRSRLLRPGEAGPSPIERLTGLGPRLRRHVARRAVPRLRRVAGVIRSRRRPEG